MKAAESGRIDALLHILSLQRPEGGIDLDEKSALVLGIDLCEMRNTARQIIVGIDLDKCILLSTAAVLVALEKHFASERLLWEPTLLKSRNWLQRVIDEFNPMIGHQKLMDWLHDWLEK